MSVEKIEHIPVEIKAQVFEEEIKGEEKEEEEEIDTPFCVKTWKDDLTFIVENKKLFANKAILALVSPVFDKMFTSEFAERDSDELHLPGKKYDDFLEFLQCVYPGIDQKQVTAANASIVAPLAEEYQVEKLLSTCDSVLAGSLHYSARTSYIYKNLKLAATFRLPKLRTKCIEYASERKLSDILEKTKTYEIPWEIHENVLTAGFKRRELDILDYKAISELSCRQKNSPRDFINYHDDKYSRQWKLIELRIADKIETNKESITKIIAEGCGEIDDSSEYFVYLPARLKRKCRLIKEGLRD